MRRAWPALLTMGALFAADVRPIPPPGVEVPEKDRAELEEGLARLSRSIDQLQGVALLPDVRIFRDAVRFALQYNEFFKPEEIGRAKDLLRQGQARASALAQGSAPWNRATGLIVRGYVSDIDGSVQPYGLVVPESYSPGLARRWRLDTWFHGRSETLSEVNFLYDRQRSAGEFTPPDTFVLHLYGRYCNANKFAGEIDLFEALDDVRRHYPIDENRISVRGFSMGGAATWHIAAHYAGLWAAAAPGAGFAETPAYLKMTPAAIAGTPGWQQKLWRLYDANLYAANFRNLPVVAYSGEIDPQKQAADVMEAALKTEGVRMVHIIGPQTPHRYHPESKVEISRRIDALAARGREAWPRQVSLVTYTLRYNRMKWVTIDALGEHWEKARVDAQMVDGGIRATTRNVTAVTFDFDPGAWPGLGGPVRVALDGQALEVEGPMSDLSFRASFHREGERWVAGAAPAGVCKRHGLQGPIDDAFLSRFLIVTPTGQPVSPETGKWVAAEQDRAIREWRRQFRGEAQVKRDIDVTAADIESANLILWGDASSNSVIAKMADRLPVRWRNGQMAAGKQSFPAASSVAIFVYPNPLNPNRYVVLNSGFTMRAADHLSNARQVPKLPDWAIVDVSVPPDDFVPGKIAAAGFFGENWEWLLARN